MVIKWSIIFACSLLGTYEAAFVDTLQPCPMKDEICLRALVQKTLKDISKTGVPDFNFPSIDPLEIKDLSIPIFNLMNITVVEGVVKGLSDCAVNKFDVRAKKGKATVELLCDFEMSGKDKIYGSSPELATILGGQTIRGDGNFKIKFSKLQITFFFRYHIVKQNDNELHFKFDKDEFSYKYVLGGIHIDADNIYLGDKDASKFAVDYFNSNWQFIIKTFGNNFFDVATNIMNDLVGNLSENIATKYYISDDLSSLVKSNK